MAALCASRLYDLVTDIRRLAEITAEVDENDHVAFVRHRRQEELKPGLPAVAYRPQVEVDAGARPPTERIQ